MAVSHVLPGLIGRRATLAGITAAHLDDALGTAGQALPILAGHRVMSLSEFLICADQLDVLPSDLLAEAERVGPVDWRPVALGGQVVEVAYGEPDDAQMIFLDQVVDVDGPRAIVLEQPTLNGSGRRAGTRYVVTTDAADAIRAGLAAPGQVDPRPVAEGGQVVETWRCQQPDAAEVFLRQVFDINGEDATILAEEAIRNTYGSIIGTRFTITVDAAEAIRAALAAPGQVENIGQVRNVGRVENIGQHVTTGPLSDAQR